MKLESPAVRKMLAAAFKSHAVLRGQKAELLDLAWRLNDGREPTTQSLGMAITVLRQGGVSRVLEKRLPAEQAERLRPIADDLDNLRLRTTVSAVPLVKLDGARVPNVFGPKASIGPLAGHQVYFGSATPVYFEDTQGIRSIPARYALVGIDSLLTSNDPTKLFEPTPGYPQELQERDYEGQQIEQEKVRAAAASIRPELIVSTNADALTGPPIVDRRGIVLGGNGRTMALKLAFRQNDRRYTAGMRRAVDQDLTYGLNGAPIEDDKVLVRVLDRVTEPLRISRLLNSPLGAAQTRETEAISLGQRLGVKSIDLIAAKLDGTETINEAIRAAGTTLVDSLSTDGVITPYNRAQWQRTRGGDVERTLNRFAIERLGDAIVAVAVGNLVVLRESTPAQLALISAIAPWALLLDRFDRKNRTGYSWVSAWRRALPFWLDTQGKAGSEFFSYWFGGSLFSVEDDPEAARRKAFLGDFEGLQLYGWMSTQHSAKTSAAQAKRTIRDIPQQFTQQRPMFSATIEELVDLNQAPEQLRLAAYMPARAAIEVLGPTELMTFLRTSGGSFSDWGMDNPRVVALYRAQLASWNPQKPERVDAQSERQRLERELSDSDEAVDLEPWAPMPGATKTPRERPIREPKPPKPVKPVKPPKPVDPWKGLRVSPKAKLNFRQLGYSTPLDLVQAINGGVGIPGYGKKRLAGLRETLRTFLEQNGTDSAPSVETAMADVQARIYEQDQRNQDAERADEEAKRAQWVKLSEQQQRIAREEPPKRLYRIDTTPQIYDTPEEREDEEQPSNEWKWQAGYELENSLLDKFERARARGGLKDFFVDLLESRGWVFTFQDARGTPLKLPYASRGPLRLWFHPQSIHYSWANYRGMQKAGRSHSLYHKGLDQANTMGLRDMVEKAIEWETMAPNRYELEVIDQERKEAEEQKSDQQERAPRRESADELEKVVAQRNWESSQSANADRERTQRRERQQELEDLRRRALEIAQAEGRELSGSELEKRARSIEETDASDRDWDAAIRSDRGEPNRELTVYDRAFRAGYEEASKSTDSRQQRFRNKAYDRVKDRFGLDWISGWLAHSLATDGDYKAPSVKRAMAIGIDVKPARHEVDLNFLGQKDIGGIRVAKGMGQLVTVTDLRNAGSRGKTCEKFTVDALPINDRQIVGAYLGWLARTLETGNFAESQDAARKLVRANPSIKLYERQEKGINVDPPDTERLVFDSAHVNAEFKRTSFGITDKKTDMRIFARNPAPTKLVELMKRIRVNRRIFEAFSFDEWSALLNSQGIKYQMSSGSD